MTTIENVKPEQIQQLQREAAAVGDANLHAICDGALAYMRQPWVDDDRRIKLVICVRVINAAEVQQEPKYKPTFFDDEK